LPENKKYIKKPEWLRIKLTDAIHYNNVKSTLSGNQLHTICESGLCPNKAECWAAGTATFMIMGDICTRSCRFCNVKTGKPLPLNLQEPENVANAVSELQLKHCVLTSVDRDDLADGGASHWAQTIKAVKQKNPQLTIEALIPDFKANKDSLDLIIQAGADILSHNLETVKKLTPKVRVFAKYELSLEVLKYISDSGVRSKSGIMVGLGETDEEIYQAMDDLLANGVKILTIGQYLQPTRLHLPVERYVHPDMFEKYRQIAENKGFTFVESGPLVRSSYHAEKQV
jgi:lipoyl synthase